MDKKGFWALLASVSKAWKTIFTRTNDSFRYRQAAGDDNILLPDKKGRAIINKIYGNTVKWNQILPVANTAGATTNGVTYTVSDNGITISTGENGATANSAYNINTTSSKVPIISGHKYYCYFKDTEFSGVRMYEALNDTGVGVTTSKKIVTANITADNVYGIRVFSGVVITTPITVRPMIIDLTANGIDNLTTTDQVEAWLALNVDEQDYYPYDEGSLVSFKGQGVKSVGFNQWDEQWLRGRWTKNSSNVYEYGTGQFQICNEHPIPALPNTTYCFRKIPTLSGPAWVTFVDENLKDAGPNYEYFNSADAMFTFTTPPNTKYLLFRYGYSSAPVTTYESGVCINISDAAKNGTYEPYKEEIIDLSGAYINVWDEQWRNGYYYTANGTFIPDANYVCNKNMIEINPDKQYYFTAPNNNDYRVFYYDIDGNYIGYEEFNNSSLLPNIPSNCHFINFRCPSSYGNTYARNICINVSNADINGTYFPHALQSAGSVTDEVTATVLTKKVRYAKLSDYAWNHYYTNSIHAITNNLVGVKDYGDSLLLAGYTKTTTVNKPIGSLGNKEYCIGTTFTGAKRLVIRDDDYQTDEAFLQDIVPKLELIYELETPIAIPHDTPMQYKVNKYSTEEVIFPESADGSPTSTAIISDIEYQITGHNYIDDLFVDMGLPSGTLWAKCDIDITKPNGFCDTPFTYEKSFFSWGNIDGHNPTSTSSFSPYDWGGENGSDPWYDGQVYGNTKGNTLQADIPVSKKYDAAMANLGQLLKMPSSAQFKELIDNCIFIDANGDEIPSTTISKLVTVNGVVGIYLKSNANGNRLFFSASGYGNDTSLGYRGSYGFYWSASFFSSRNARNMYFSSGGVYPQGNNYRYFGFAIRPIKNQ